MSGGRVDATLTKVGRSSPIGERATPEVGSEHPEQLRRPRAVDGPTYAVSTRIAHALDPDIRVMVGGHHAKAMPGTVLRDPRFERLTALVLSEGETRVAALLDDHTRRATLPQVMWRDPRTGTTAVGLHRSGPGIPALARRRSTSARGIVGTRTAVFVASGSRVAFPGSFGRPSGRYTRERRSRNAPSRTRAVPPRNRVRERNPDRCGRHAEHRLPVVVPCVVRPRSPELPASAVYSWCGRRRVSHRDRGPPGPPVAGGR
ncbi:hypothetical protein EHYA_03879 [Embleya hyalina]|uniref:Uncharacterized protein n=1 Tax=Embleya hyalina TaxID=516124 RepID=A0A401YNM6_9ACTN|nr:hypothetical protein EHYA_03879 [Embleya hyalina]